MRLHCIISLLALTLFPILGHAQSRPVSSAEQEIDAAVRQALDSVDVVPGLQVAIVQGDSVAYVKGFGTRNVSTGAPVTRNSSFYVASTTKSFTGLMTALLAEQDSLDLDAPLSTYLPTLTFDSTGLSADRLSLRDHLTHRAGYENEVLAYRPPSIGRLPVDEIVRVAGAYSRPTSISFNYTNEAYIVAAAALTQATGTSWKRLLVDNIFDPLGMSHTTPHMSVATKQEFAAPHGVRRGTVVPIEAKADTNMHAAGGLVASAPDLGRFLQVMMNDGRLDGEQVLPIRAVREALAPQMRCDKRYYRFRRYAYGFGWYHGDYRGRRLVHHFGGFRGHHGHMSFMPEQDLGIVVLANSGSPLPHPVAATIYDLLLNQYAPKQYGRDLQEIASFAETRTADRDSARAAWMDSPSDAAPAHPPSAYVGTYENPMWGTITVEKTDDGLRATLPPRTAALVPYRQDTFLVDWEVGSPLPLKLVFSAPDDGTASTIRWSHPSFELNHAFQRRN
jgi:CubicO group peptidase (beta-lactamase class C family)